MITFDVSEIIQCPREVVFAGLAESDGAEWQPNLVEDRMTSTGPLSVGSTGVSVRRVAGETVETAWIVTAYAPPARFTIKSLSGPVSYELAYHCEPHGDATRCTLSFAGEPRGFFALEESVLAQTIKDDFAGDLARFKAQLERPA